ncbi:MAG: RecX family transcriptional regulator [Bacteroidales bacterium]|nr:RecX family transcriptional regulator [Bacteroidales bacterium]
MISKDDKLLSSLQTLCARKEYCSADMYKKALKGLDGDEDGAAEMVALLVKDKFVDDLRYATAFARDKAGLDGWGPVKIRFQLRGKGIAAATIDEALAAVDADKAGERMRAVLEAKARTLKGDPELRLKLLKFGLQRGYEYDRLDPAVRDILGR